MARSGLEKFVINSGGARAVLRSEGVRADLVKRLKRAKMAADWPLLALEGSYSPTIVGSGVGTGRAHATLTGVPLPLERSRRILGGALDAIE